MGLAGDIARLVGGEKERERGDFRGGSEAADGLAVDEVLADLVERLSARTGEVLDPSIERGRLDRTGTDRVGPDPLPDEICRHRLGEPDDGRLGGAVDVAVRYRPDRRHYGRDVDDRPAL